MAVFEKGMNLPVVSANNTGKIDLQGFDKYLKGFIRSRQARVINQHFRATRSLTYPHPSALQKLAPL